jgi:hypothetical protein
MNDGDYAQYYQWLQGRVNNKRKRFQRSAEPLEASTDIVSERNKSDFG